MERLFLPLIFLSPILLVVGAYRVWQLLHRRIDFKNKAGLILYVSSLVIALSGFFYMGWHFCRCVWPNHCGEGFASGYIAAGILLGAGTMAVVYIVSETILIAVRKRG